MPVFSECMRKSSCKFQAQPSCFPNWPFALQGLELKVHRIGLSNDYRQNRCSECWPGQRLALRLQLKSIWGKLSLITFFVMKLSKAILSLPIQRLCGSISNLYFWLEEASIYLSALRWLSSKVEEQWKKKKEGKRGRIQRQNKTADESLSLIIYESVVVYFICLKIYIRLRGGRLRELANRNIFTIIYGRLLW